MYELEQKSSLRTQDIAFPRSYISQFPGGGYLRTPLQMRGIRHQSAQELDPPLCYMVSTAIVLSKARVFLQYTNKQNCDTYANISKHFILDSEIIYVRLALVSLSTVTEPWVSRYR
jgi:hypothetical protein